MGNFRSWLSGAKVTGGLIAFGIVVLVIATLMSQPARVSANTEPKPSATATATTKAPAAPAAAKPTSTCDKKFVQVAGNNASNRVDADFEQKVAQETAKADTQSDGLKTAILRHAANNGQRLAIWANGFGLHKDPNSWKSLVSGTCLSEEGKATYNKLDGALSATGVTFASADAPATGYNTGVNKGRFGVSATPGVTGNRDAIKVTLRDKSMIYILKRCGNVVRPGKTGLPPAKTDNPVPPKVNPPRVAPPRVNPPRVNPPRINPPRVVRPCPSGQVKNQNGVCLTPKSSNPNAYQAPGRDNTRDSGTGVKPRVPRVMTPPESSPPPVVTRRTGGGGVVDTPTNKPGSETGVKAPGATPVPTTPRRVPTPEPIVNPPAGGDNTTDPGLPSDPAWQ